MLVAVLLAAVGNRVSMMYVPPNEVVVTGTLFLGSSQVTTAFYGNFAADSACTLPASVVLGSASVARFSPTVVADYVYLHYQERLHRVTCALEYSAGSSPAAATNVQMRLSVSDLISDVAVMYDFYGTHMLFFAGIPESYRSHLLDRGKLVLGEPPTDLANISVVSANGTRFRLSAAHWNHVLTAADCGKQWAFLPGVSVDVPCTGDEPPSGVSIVSLRALGGTGIHVRDGNVTVYTTNPNDFDPITAWAFVVALMLYLGVWLMWTRDLPEFITSHEDRERVWIEMAVNGAPITTAVFMTILSRNLWTAVQKSHGM